MSLNDPNATAADDVEPGRADATDRPMGIEIPQEHVGAFVAEVFTDVERNTSWSEVVNAIVHDDARGEWNDLPPRARLREALELADSFDQRCLAQLRSMPLQDATADGVEETFREAMRYRRNADILRDAIADAYASGLVGDQDLVQAVETCGFTTERIEQRETKIEQVTKRFDLSFRPYGGKLMHPDGEPGEGGGP